jgi:hypothetical protein
MKRCSVIAGCMIGLAGFAAGVHAQSTPPQPNPPPEVCVNNKCSTTKVATPPAPTGPSGSVKWNPGHYMASNSILSPSSTVATVQSEMDDIANYDNIIGYRVFITWGALESSQGVYNFSVLDAVLNRLKTHYAHPKHMVVVVLPGYFSGAWQSGDGRAVPLYIQQNSAYGASPVSGSYGWWGQNSRGASTGAYTAALFRPAVMNRYIAMIQALAAHYDSEPYFEAFMFQENAWMGGLWSGAPDLSTAGGLTQFESMLSAAVTAFPHTSVIMENTWWGDPSTTQNLELWMVNHRVAPGTADTVGQTAFNMGYATSAMGLNWGLQAYLGITYSGPNATSNYSGGDLRQRSRAMLDVEGMDLGGGYYSNWGAPNGYHPSDIVAALNGTYQASHAFWTHLFGSEPVSGGGTVSSASPWSAWSQLAPVVNAAPLTHTGYPPNYP